MQEASDLVDTVAANVRELRHAAGLTLPDLAARSGLGRSTLAALEAGNANPSIETLWAVAAALGVPFGRLVEAPQPTVRLVRDGEGIHVEAESGLVARLLASRPSRGPFDLFMLETGPDRERRADPHAAGTVEHLLGIAGVLRCGPAHEPVELEPGDLLSFAADVPHVYAGLRADTRTLLVMDYGR